MTVKSGISFLTGGLGGLYAAADRARAAKQASAETSEQIRQDCLRAVGNVLHEELKQPIHPEVRVWLRARKLSAT